MEDVPYNPRHDDAGAARGIRDHARGPRDRCSAGSTTRRCCRRTPCRGARSRFPRPRQWPLRAQGRPAVGRRAHRAAHRHRARSFPPTRRWRFCARPRRPVPRQAGGSPDGQAARAATALPRIAACPRVRDGRCARRVRAVHRLDTGTSGCGAHAGRSLRSAARAVPRAHRDEGVFALVAERLEHAQRIDAPIGSTVRRCAAYVRSRRRTPRTPLRRARRLHRGRSRARPARRDVVRARTGTGARHQIRVHLRERGTPAARRSASLYGDPRLRQRRRLSPCTRAASKGPIPRPDCADGRRGRRCPGMGAASRAPRSGRPRTAERARPGPR